LSEYYNFDEFAPMVYLWSRGEVTGIIASEIDRWYLLLRRLGSIKLNLLTLQWKKKISLMIFRRNVKQDIHHTLSQRIIRSSGTSSADFWNVNS